MPEDPARALHPVRSHAPTPVHEDAIYNYSTFIKPDLGALIRALEAELGT